MHISVLNRAEVREGQGSSFRLSELLINSTILSSIHVHGIIGMCVICMHRKLGVEFSIAVWWILLELCLACVHEVFTYILDSHHAPDKSFDSEADWLTIIIFMSTVPQLMMMGQHYNTSIVKLKRAELLQQFFGNNKNLVRKWHCYFQLC